jgi:hypothetical protein
MTHCTFCMRHRKSLVIAVVLAVILLGLGTSVIMDWRGHVKRGELSDCLANLHRLTQMLDQYAATHDGTYPPTLSQVVNPPDSPRCLICPASRYVAAQDNATRPIDEQTHCSYLYFGANRTRDDMKDRVLICEKGAFHSKNAHLCVIHDKGKVFEKVFLSASELRARGIVLPVGE